MENREKGREEKEREQDSSLRKNREMFQKLSKEEQERVRRRREIRRRMQKKAVIRRRIILCAGAGVLLIALVAGMVMGVSSLMKTDQRKGLQEGVESAKGSAAGGKGEALAEEEAAAISEDSPVAQAELLAAMYDYDKAIELLKGQKGYDGDTAMQAKVAEYETAKAACQPWPIEEVTHIFYHSMIRDTAKAFDGDNKAADYNQVMTTISEFNKITQEMYDRGYVLVSIYDLAHKDANGNMVPGEILLPPGKIPFVLSQDDVSYYHYMDGDGYPSRLIVDENGDIRNEYIEDDGSVTVGDFDMVPLIDRFVEQHPDFSYRGAKGIIALTGYNGILGYRTDISYQERPADLDQDKVKYLEAHPDFSLEAERAAAREVAAAMREKGWLFASHTWGHQNIAQISLEKLQADTQKWMDNVYDLVGGTDIIIFAFGTDLTISEDYYGDKFEYLKSQGFDYYCNVDSSKYYVQRRDRYFRMGRRNLDGYRMYYHPGLVEDLFDAPAVFDPARPTPVPEMA